jgi:Flp pilus assembly protein TadG
MADVIKQSGKRLRRRIRKAAVTVELAIVAPVMFAMLFGIIEFGWMFTVQHTMVNAAREGARLGVLQGTTVSEIEAESMSYLTAMGLDSSVAIDVTEATTDDPHVTVRLTVPREDVSLVGNFFGFSGGTVEGVATMRKEGM